MSSKIRVTSEQYKERKEYLEKKYNKEYMDKIINKKLKKLEVADDNKVEELVEPITTDTEENRIKLNNRVGKVEKTNKSTGTMYWSVFRSKEYATYKKQVPKGEQSYTNFAKLAGYVWSGLDENERYDAINNGWGGDWSKVIIRNDR